MMGVAVEQMLDLWCTELRQVKAHLIPTRTEDHALAQYRRPMGLTRSVLKTPE